MRKDHIYGVKTVDHRGFDEIRRILSTGGWTEPKTLPLFDKGWRNFVIRKCFYHFKYILRLIGWTMNNLAGVFKGNKYLQNSTRCLVSSFDFFLQLGELVHLDVACSMKPKKTLRLVPCRRLPQRRDLSVSSCRATGAAAARNPMAPTTA